MANVVVILVILGVFIYGFCMMDRLGKMLDERSRRKR